MRLYPDKRSSSPSITPLGGKFEKNERLLNGPAPAPHERKSSCQTKAVDKPMTFSLGGKKIMDREQIVPFQFNREASTAGAASDLTAAGADNGTRTRTPNRRGSVGGSAASPSPLSPTGVTSPTSGCVPSGLEHTIRGDLGGRARRGSSPSVASAASGLDFGNSPTWEGVGSSRGRRHASTERQQGSPEYTHSTHANKNDTTKNDMGKKCSMERHTDPGYMAPTTTSQFRNSQRYRNSDLRSFESATVEHEDRRSTIKVHNEVASNKQVGGSLLGVMKAAPMPPPPKSTGTAPWVHPPLSPDSGNGNGRQNEGGASVSGIRRSVPRDRSPIADTTCLGGAGGSTDQRRGGGRRCNSPTPAGMTMTTSLNPEVNAAREIQSRSTVRMFHTQRSNSPIPSWE